MNIEDLLSDDDSDGAKFEKNNNEPPKPKLNMFSQPKLINTAPVNIDNVNVKSSESDKKEFDKISIPIMSSSSGNEEPVKKDNPPPKKNDLLDFVLFSNPNPINIPKKAQDKISNSSSSNKFKEVILGPGKGISKLSVMSSTVVQPPPPTKKEDPISYIDERKNFEELIASLRKQKEEIKSEYPRAINEKSYEYSRIEKLNKNEIEKLEDKYENKLSMQQNTFRDKEEKYNKQKSKIEDEKSYKINNIRDMQKKFYDLQLEQQGYNFNHQKEALEVNHNIEIEKITMKIK